MKKQRAQRWKNVITVLFVLLIGFPLLYILFAVVLGLIPVNADRDPPSQGIVIGVQTNGAHVGLVLPLQNKKSPKAKNAGAT